MRVRRRLDVVSMSAANKCNEKPTDSRLHLKRKVLVRTNTVQGEPQWFAHEESLVDGRVAKDCYLRFDGFSGSRRMGPSRNGHTSGSIAVIFGIVAG